MKNKVTISLTDEQLKQLDCFATLSNRTKEEYASDIIAVFLTQISTPIVQLPNQSKVQENE